MSPQSESDTVSQDPKTVHATTVVLAGRGALLKGPSGSGKSGLALQLMAIGAQLVADDRTILSRRANQVIASAPVALANRIEARFVGILRVPSAASAPLRIVVDMASEETDRLPQPRCETLLGVALPMIRKSSAAHFPATLALYLQSGQLE